MRGLWVGTLQRSPGRAPQVEQRAFFPPACIRGLCTPDFGLQRWPGPAPQVGHLRLRALFFACRCRSCSLCCHCFWYRISLWTFVSRFLIFRLRCRGICCAVSPASRAERNPFCGVASEGQRGGRAGTCMPPIFGACTLRYSAAYKSSASASTRPASVRRRPSLVTKSRRTKATTRVG